jgi:hypothetical protein
VRCARLDSIHPTDVASNNRELDECKLAQVECKSAQEQLLALADNTLALCKQAE